MSGSGGYQYSFEDRERDERRRLTTLLAELRVRRTAVNTRLRRLSCRLADEIGEPTANADSTALAALVAAATVEVEAAEKRFDAVQSERLRARIDARTARRHPVEGTEPAGRVVTVSLAESRARALAAAERTLLKEGPLCDPEDLDGLTALLDEIAEAPAEAAVTQRVLRLEQAVAASVRARREREEEAVVRGRLFALVESAAPELRAGLRAELDAAADLAVIGERIGTAVREAAAAADAAVVPAKVAAVAAEALRAIGCSVGEEFETVLARSEPVVVPLGDAWDAERYRLLVRLDPRRRRIHTAVVRNPACTAEPAEDEAAQRLYCERGLQEAFGDELRGNGVTVLQHDRIEPGVLPMPSAPGEAWNRRRRPPREEGRSRDH